MRRIYIAESMSNVSFFCLVFFLVELEDRGSESNEGRMVDALAHGGDEGRDKLR